MSAYIRVNEKRARILQKKIGLIHIDINSNMELLEEEIPYGYSPDHPLNCPNVLNCPGTEIKENISTCFSEDGDFNTCPYRYTDKNPRLNRERRLYNDEGLLHQINSGIIDASTMFKKSKIIK
jgi:hypothetical protein